MNSRTQWLALFLLGGVWAGLVLWGVAFTPEPERAPLKYVSGQKASREAGRGKTEAGLKVRVDLLEAGQRQTEGTFVAPKNIFAPLRHEEAGEKFAKAHRVPSPPLPLPPVAPVAPAGPTPEELAAQAARAELAQFRYLGFLSREGRDEAFLSKGKELHIVKAGETIEQRVLVKTVTTTDVILQETRSQVEKKVLLAGDGK
jgi:hypothetical protein